MFATPTFPSYFYPMGFVSTGNLWQVPSLPDPSVSTVWQLPSPQDPSLYQTWQMPSPHNRSVSQNWQMPSLQNRSVSQNYLMPRPQDPPSYRYPNLPNYSFLNYPPPEIKLPVVPEEVDKEKVVQDDEDDEDEAGGHDDMSDIVQATVDELGYISLYLRDDMIVLIAPNQAVLVSNGQHGSQMSLSGCGTQMALVHEQGRVLQFSSKIEVQVEKDSSVQNAKIWSRGISFTSNQKALTYMLDQAGARTTSDTFRDLYSEDIAHVLFDRSHRSWPEIEETRVDRSIRELDLAKFWKNPDDANCWEINGIQITQTTDGLVSVDRKIGKEAFALKSSPNNGRARMQSSFFYATASLGDEAHLFVKSNERRIYHDGGVFNVRNVGHSAGFDGRGNLKIWL